MRSFFVFAAVAFGLTGAGALVGWGAEREAASAVAMHAEPFLIVGLVWAAAIARWSRRMPLSLGLSLGAIGFVAGVRLPFPVAPPEGVAPEWSARASRCAAGLRVPEGTVRLLQWTLDPTVRNDAVRKVVSAASPDVVVFHGVTEYAQIAGVDETVGGEQRVFGRRDGAVVVLARGGFHPCGDTTEWMSETPAGDGFFFGFVGVPPANVFPLLVTALPSPLDGVFGSYGERMHDATSALFGALDGLQSASMVVVADARAPRATRALEAWPATLGLQAAAAPPSWPARIGPLPFLPLHPYTRVWAGPVWQRVDAGALEADAGRFAPVLTTIGGLPLEEMAPVEVPRRPLSEPRLERAPNE